MADGNSSPASNARGVDHAADHGAVNNTPPAPDAMSDAVPNQFPPLPQPVEMRQLALTFNGSAGESVTFKIKNTMKLRKAMEAYSARVQRPVDQLRFLFDGQRLRNEDTPIEREMEDGDIVEVHMEQIGGGSDDEAWEDWVEVKDEGLLQKTVDEKARLSRVIDWLNKELYALTTNNRALAKENNSLKVNKKDLTADYQELFVEYSNLMADFQRVDKLITCLKKRDALHDKEKRAFNEEKRALNSSLSEKDAAISQKDAAIDSTLEDFQFSFQ